MIMVKYDMVLNTLWKKESWNFIQSMNSCEALTKVLWRKDTVRYWAYKQAQPSAIIIWSNIVRYCINYSRHSSRRAIRCWIHKRHPIPRPNGWAMGWLLWIFLGKINWIITALHCIWLLPTLFSTCGDSSDQCSWSMHVSLILTRFIYAFITYHCKSIDVVLMLSIARISVVHTVQPNTHMLYIIHVWYVEYYIFCPGGCFITLGELPKLNFVTSHFCR